MQEQPIVKGRINLGNFIFILLGGLGCAALFCYLMPWDIWLGNDGSGIGVAVMPSFFGAFSLVAFQSLITDYNYIFVYADRIESVSIFGKHRRTVLLSDILAYKKEHIKGDKSSYERYRLYTHSGRFEFTDNNCKNHLEVWGAITEGRENDESKIDDTFYVARGWATSFIVAGVLFCVAGVYLFNKNLRPLASDELMPIEGIFQPCDSINNVNKHGEGEAFKLYEYPRMLFSISGEAYAALDTAAYFNEAADSAPVSLMVERRFFESEYRQALKAKKSSEYLYIIPVYAMHGGRLTYVGFNNHAHTRVLGIGGKVTWIGFGVLFIIIGAVIEIVRRRQNAKNLDTVN